MPTDADLLRAWRAGDAQSGRALVDRYVEAMYAFFRSKIAGDLDDLIQRVFLSLVESRDRIENVASVRAYLFRIARNELYSTFRRRKTDRVVGAVGDVSVEDLGERPCEVIARRQEQRLLLRALRRIPLDDQIALELFYWESLSGAEIARVLGVPEGTARTRLRRARAALRAQVERLAATAGAARSTSDDLDRWVASLRSYMAAESAVGEG